MNILIIVGTRPNFLKLAPLVRALDHENNIHYDICHTGQHYSKSLSKIFFDELNIPTPNYHFNINQKNSALRLSEMISKISVVINKKNYDFVLVVGDVDSTLAGALAAIKQDKKIIHLESGLRSFDDSMPEEINRKIVDTISHILFTTQPEANANLKKENISKNKIYYVGNIMIDNLFYNLKLIKKSSIKKKFENYIVTTIHRKNNISSKIKLQKIFDQLNKATKYKKILYILHPHTNKKIKQFNIHIDNSITILKPQNHFNMIQLMKNADLVITDSGGIQEESTALNIPCYTVRNSTERPITIQQGTNFLIDDRKLDKMAKLIKNNHYLNLRTNKRIKYWDGKTANRIVKILKEL